MWFWVFWQTAPRRTLRFVRGNILHVAGLAGVDIVVCETDMPARSHVALGRLLCTMRPGARLVSYAYLPSIWAVGDMPFTQLPINVSSHDR
jgi:hypothetical protein